MIDKWVVIIKNTLETHFPDLDYVQIESEELVGCFIICFASSKIAKHITNVAKNKFKLGMGGNVANKGATSVRFEIYGDSFVFVNMHLVHGRHHASALKRAS